MLLREWILALCVLTSTFFLARSAQALLKRLNSRNENHILRDLAPSLSNLFYIIGLKLFVDVAPLSKNFEKWGDGSLYVFAVIIILRLIQKGALIGIEWSASRTQSVETLEQGFIPLIRNITTLFIFFSGGIIILKHFNYDAMSLVTALGVSSLAIGLAAKDTLSNMISGFILIIDRNLRPGDRINLSGTIGDVELIGLRSTQLRVTDGNTLIVPNSELVNTKILNISMPTRSVTCSVNIRVPYRFSFVGIRSQCLAALNRVNKITKEKPPWIYLTSLSEGYQLINIGFWVTDMNDAAAAISEFNEQILQAFQQEHIQLLGPIQYSPEVFATNQRYCDQ